MKKIMLNILSIQLLADGGAAILTAKRSDNPSANGVFKVSPGLFRRLVTRCLGVFNPIAFKHIVELGNGSAKYAMDAYDRKIGEAWENKVTGQTGTYTKDFTDYRDQEVQLGMISKQKLVEISLQAAFANQEFSAPAPKVAVATPEAAVEQSEEPKV